MDNTQTILRKPNAISNNPPQMNTELLDQYRLSRTKSDKKYLKLLNSPIMFKLFLAGRLPMGFMAGLKVKHVDTEQCQITVPYRWMNQNPFRSTYFAVLSMAAEMSTGMFGMMMTIESDPSVSMLVSKVESEFIKKATGITTFTCTEGKLINEAIEKAVLTGEGQQFLATTVGTSKTGEVESRFKVQWSFKMRSKK